MTAYARYYNANARKYVILFLYLIFRRSPPQNYMVETKKKNRSCCQDRESSSHY